MGGSPLQLHCPLRDTRCVGTWQRLKILTILNQLCSCKHLRLTISTALTFVGEPPGDMLWGGGMSSQSSWTPSSSLLSSPDSILPRPPPELHLQMPPGQDCPILACVWVSRLGALLLLILPISSPSQVLGLPLPTAAATTALSQEHQHAYGCLCADLCLVFLPHLPLAFKQFHSSLRGVGGMAAGSP